LVTKNYHEQGGELFDYAKISSCDLIERQIFLSLSSFPYLYVELLYRDKIIGKIVGNN
jgi:hypothetical protein